MTMQIESKEFRKAARANCYQYGPLCIYSDTYIGFEDHNLPSYSSKASVGAIEKFLSLIQGIDRLADGNDPADKMPRPLPGVQWENDRLEQSLTINGTMYFLDYRDYKSIKSRIHSELVSQGWTVMSSKLGPVPVRTYRPTRTGRKSLYNDDPADAAGMAMMVSSMQHVSDQLNMMGGYINENAEQYAKGYARYQSMATQDNLGLGAFGANVKAGIDALGANMNGGVLKNWQTAGHPVSLCIDGKVQKQSLNFVMTGLKLTEKAYVIDDTSGNYVYPTEMSVDLEITNLYGKLFTAAQNG